MQHQESSFDALHICFLRFIKSTSNKVIYVENGTKWNICIKWNECIQNIKMHCNVCQNGRTERGRWSWKWNRQEFESDKKWREKWKTMNKSESECVCAINILVCKSFFDAKMFHNKIGPLLETMSNNYELSIFGYSYSLLFALHSNISLYFIHIIHEVFMEFFIRFGFY